MSFVKDGMFVKVYKPTPRRIGVFATVDKSFKDAYWNAYTLWYFTIAIGVFALNVGYVKGEQK